MNKKVNFHLNIYEYVAILLASTCMGLALLMKLSEATYPAFFGYSVSIFGMFFELIVISIELFLFILLKNSYKFIYIFYVILELIIMVLVTISHPFMGVIVVFAFSMIKNGLRIRFVNNIYIPKEFNRYCKMFGVKFKDYSKKRKYIPNTEKSDSRGKIIDKSYA